jgi:hypothetical protein
MMTILGSVKFIENSSNACRQEDAIVLGHRYIFTRLRYFVRICRQNAAKIELLSQMNLTGSALVFTSASGGYG